MTQSPSQPSSRRFTYGDQFEQSSTPLQDLLALCAQHVVEPNEPFPGDRAALQEAIRALYFPKGSADNSRKLAMNCVLSLNAYGIIEFDASNQNRRYRLTPLFEELQPLVSDLPALFARFAVHILSERDGLVMLRLIENIRARGEQVTLEYISEELNDLGLRVPPNSTYVSTMRGWLGRADVFRGASYEINWDVVYDLLHTDAAVVDQLYGLSPEQKYFLLSMVSLAVLDWMASNKVANHARSVYSVRITTKNLVKDVIEPLVEGGLIESQKTTTGRGAKPHEVRLTEQGRNDLFVPLLQILAQVTEFTSTELNRTFEEVVAELDDPDKYVRGIALELLAVWIVRLLGLRFSKWRLRSFQATGGGEVDVLAASDKIVYNRWQLQCKNIKGAVDVDTVAKEVGLTFLTKADVVMIVTTGDFSRDAVNYANQVTDNSRYYVILLDGRDIDRIIEDRARIVDILNVKARRVFAKKELGITEFGDEFESEEELGEEIAEAAEQVFGEDKQTP